MGRETYARFLDHETPPLTSSTGQTFKEFGYKTIIEWKQTSGPKVINKFSITKLCRTEIKHSDWLKEVR